MNKVDFGDFYRFCVSLGLALLLSSIVIPWMLIKDPGLLKLDTAASNSFYRPSYLLLNQSAQEAAVASENRIRYVSLAYRKIGVVSMTLFILGLLLFFYGFFNWWARQRQRDRKENFEFEQLLDTKMPAASNHEVVLQAAANAQAEGSQDASVDGKDEQAEVASRYYSDVASNWSFKLSSETDVERRIFSALRLGAAEGFSIFEQRRLGRAVVDGVLVSNDKSKSDILVEIKVIRRGFKSNWLYEVIQRVSALVDLYRSSLNREARGLIIVVVATSVLDRLRDSDMLGGVAVALDKIYPDISVRIIDADLLDASGVFDETFLSAGAGLRVSRKA